MPVLSEVIEALDTLWPRAWAEEWDAVGPVCGAPDAPVERVLFAVDPVLPVVAEAVELGAQLLVTHHPLYLRGTTTVAADSFKGRAVHTLISHGIGLHVAHTNADRANPGVSDALAGALGLRVTGPLVADPADPAGRRGLGRITEPDQPLTLDGLVERAAAQLPGTAQGIRAAGDPDRPLDKVAVCGGAGDGLFARVRDVGADAYLTADLRHHPASEAAEAAAFAVGGPALIDAAHWATEWPWCEQAAAELDAVSDRHGWALRTHVSRLVTDPWTTHAPSVPAAAPITPGAPN